MVEKLKLALKNPVSPLLLRVGVLTALIFWLRADTFGGFKVVLLMLALLVFYLKPAVNSGKYWVSVLVWLMIVLLTPKVAGLTGFYVNLILGALAFILLGVKNLVFLKWQTAYYLLHLVLVVGVAGLFFLGNISQILLFVILFFLFREFYAVVVAGDLEITNLIAAVESMLIVQAAWVASFFSTSFLVSGSFLVLATFVLHDLLVNYFKDTFTKQLALRNLAVFLILSLLILIMPVWGFQ